MLRRNIIDPQSYMPMIVNNQPMNDKIKDNVDNTKQNNNVEKINDLLENNDTIDIKYIIKNKPKPKIVREYLKTQLESLDDKDNIFGK